MAEERDPSSIFDEGPLLSVPVVGSMFKSSSNPPFMLRGLYEGLDQHQEEQKFSNQE